MRTKKIQKGDIIIMKKSGRFIVANNPPVKIPYGRAISCDVYNLFTGALLHTNELFYFDPGNSVTCFKMVFVSI